jgi:hypothetical protein
VLVAAVVVVEARLAMVEVLEVMLEMEPLAPQILVAAVVEAVAQPTKEQLSEETAALV